MAQNQRQDVHTRTVHTLTIEVDMTNLENYQAGDDIEVVLIGASYTAPIRLSYSQVQRLTTENR